MAYAKATAALLFVLLGACSCSPKEPVLYPNEQLRRAGEERARADITECLEATSEQVTRPTVPKRIANGLVCVGVVAGLAAAAYATETSSSSENLTCGPVVHGDEDEFRDLVERCLRDRGYRPVLWR
jgi:hypothetical protein